MSVTGMTGNFLTNFELYCSFLLAKNDSRNRLRWYGQVLRKDDSACVKGYVTLEVEEAGREVGRGKHGKRLLRWRLRKPAER